MNLTLPEWLAIDAPPIVLMIILFVIGYFKLEKLDTVVHNKTGPPR